MRCDRRHAHHQLLFCAAHIILLQAFATDSNNGTKQTIEDINKMIGLHIKEAAAHLGTMHVWQANAAIGKFVKKAAEDAASGKLKVKGVYTGTAASKK